MSPFNHVDLIKEKLNNTTNFLTLLLYIYVCVYVALFTSYVIVVLETLINFPFFFSRFDLCSSPYVGLNCLGNLLCNVL